MHYNILTYTKTIYLKHRCLVNQFSSLVFHVTALCIEKSRIAVINLNNRSAFTIIKLEI